MESVTGPCMDDFVSESVPAPMDSGEQPGDDAQQFPLRVETVAPPAGIQIEVASPGGHQRDISAVSASSISAVLRARLPELHRCDSPLISSGNASPQQHGIRTFSHHRQLPPPQNHPFSLPSADGYDLYDTLINKCPNELHANGVSTKPNVELELLMLAESSSMDDERSLGILITLLDRIKELEAENNSLRTRVARCCDTACTCCCHERA
ncbi:hypothetical protein M427DRAFT_54035 [Gonapodya prolifera JEL478]|uniref:Uncharacterized protein n=1 Tax=Gonapodya prolifera (strain JEL478) TaxID=1344416 RepID=A0A139AN79_GONPJ|nr:hypothetical protein M427DRAFT_54035 [Gonapodya prolifera JEL478]|eukprot:KXS18210.1 hypothetical protein M427DRAFT_54035 [Gonapodya prolifera JEL478]